MMNQNAQNLPLLEPTTPPNSPELNGAAAEELKQVREVLRLETSRPLSYGGVAHGQPNPCSRVYRVVRLRRSSLLTVHPSKACMECRRGRMRCSEGRPCTNCIDDHKTCIYALDLVPRLRASEKEHVLKRVKCLEGLQKLFIAEQLGPCGQSSGGLSGGASDPAQPDATVGEDQATGSQEAAS
ncbi:hypothetical protein BDY21DRAFT_367705 [Lineolata rhizophorae]|uniref:Zn(2)-C6 fungal-type domain-containing protein n=1 Tax=Lineolata rhizophorae TaxID=578093 RepID=A0A6A6NM65_9PEZI|nr:hypothetical protein BDY21DRAFT_367705 [Lineolata rhizophorae]